MKSFKAKYIALLALLPLLLFSGCISERASVLAPLSRYPGETVRIPSSTLKFAGIMSGESMVRKLSTVEIFSCANPAYAGQIADLTRVIADGRNLELLIEARDSTDLTRIYAIQGKKQGVLKELLVESTGRAACDIVYIKGKLDLPALISDTHSLDHLIEFH